MFDIINNVSGVIRGGVEIDPPQHVIKKFSGV